MGSKVLRFLYIVLPFNSIAVVPSDERCSFREQLNMQVCRFLRLSDLLAALRQSARAKCTVFSRVFLVGICKSCYNYSSVTGWVFYKQVGSMGTSHCLKPIFMHIVV